VRKLRETPRSRAMAFASRLLGVRRQPLTLLLVTMSGLLWVGVVGNLVYDWLLEDGHFTPWLIGFILGLPALAFILWQREAWSTDTPGTTEDAIVPHRGLIWLLSPRSIDLPLIAIRHHQPALTHLWVIRTRGEDALEQAFETLAERLEDEQPEVKVVAIDIDAPTVICACEAVQNIYQFYLRAAGLHPEEVVADFTGGLKPLTAGMFMACSANNWPMEYIATERLVNGQPVPGTQAVMRVEI